MTSAEARFNKSLRPRKPEGSLGRTAQDVHLHSHTAPELCIQESRRDREEWVTWTLTKKLDCHLRVQARSRGGRWCWTLKRVQKRSRVGRWSWAPKVGLVFCFSCSSTAVLRIDIVFVTLLRTAVETTIAEYTNCFEMARCPLP